MKLLKKSTVTSELNLQRKNQIDEGIVLAKKVDALRKTLSELEAQHQNFIISKEQELSTRFKELENSIKELKAEIRELEQRRSELLKPLDAEWAELKSKEIYLQQKEEDNQKWFIQLQQSEKDILLTEEELERKSIVLDNNLVTANKERLEANILLTNALNKAKETEDRSVKAEEILQKHIKELMSREAQVASKEREVEIIKANLLREEKAINKQRLLLVDREATLERELKRQKLTI